MAWFDKLGGIPKETHIISQGLTIHIMDGGVLKNAKGKVLPHNFSLLRETTGENIPEYVMERIDHFVAQRVGDKKAERIRKAAELAAAAEREAIRREEAEEEREARQQRSAEAEERYPRRKAASNPSPVEDDDDDEDFEDFDEVDEELEALEKELSGPSPKKTSSKAAKKKSK